MDGMSTPEPTRTLRLLCANATGMVGFLLAFWIGRGIAGALIVGVVVGGIGYVASSAVVEYAAG